MLGLWSFLRFVKAGESLLQRLAASERRALHLIHRVSVKLLIMAMLDIVHKNTVNALMEEMGMVISDKMVYSSKRENAYQFSSQFRWDKIGNEFDAFLEGVNQCHY